MKKNECGDEIPIRIRSLTSEHNDIGNNEKNEDGKDKIINVTSEIKYNEKSNNDFNIESKSTPDDITRKNIKASKLICTACGKTFSNVQNKNKHYLHQHVINKKKYKCYTCDIEFNYKDNMEKHKTFKHYKCEICDKTYILYKKVSHIKKFHNFEQHLMDQKLKKKRLFYNCHICSLSIGSKSNLSKHIKSIHKDIKLFKCELCDVGFYNKTNL